MDTSAILARVGATASPLARQLLVAGLITGLFEERQKPPPVIIGGLEDLIIDRLNACKHWQSQGDCEAAELLVIRYRDDLDWEYLERKAKLPENDLLAELGVLKERRRP